MGNGTGGMRVGEEGGGSDGMALFELGGDSEVRGEVGQ